jgi:hypothetical protein
MQEILLGRDPPTTSIDNTDTVCRYDDRLSKVMIGDVKHSMPSEQEQGTTPAMGTISTRLGSIHPEVASQPT